jgi:predicted nucleic acid-binding Zn ribbon protein
METISIVLSRALVRLGLENEWQGWRAVDEWSYAVGPRVSKHTRAVGFRDGALSVEVEGSAWIHELGFLKRELVRRINRHLGSNLVREVRLIVPRGGILR